MFFPTVSQLRFIQEFKFMQADAADINAKSGFVNTDTLMDELEQYLADETPVSDYFKPLFSMFKNSRIGLKLMLIVTELGELLEGVRKTPGAPDSHIPEFTNEEVELADAVIRAMNYATDRHLRLAEALVAKNEYNRTRHDHTPAARAAEGGKKF